MNKLVAVSALLLVWMGAAQAQENNPSPNNQPTPKDWHGPKHDGGKEGMMKHGKMPMDNCNGTMANNHRQFGKMDEGMHHHPKVHLSEAQKQEAKKIKENYHTQLATLNKQDKMTLGEFKKKTAALEKDRKQKMDALLTPEQKQQVAKWKQKADEDRQVATAARLERMKIRVNGQNSW